MRLVKPGGFTRLSQYIADDHSCSNRRILEHALGKAAGSKWDAGKIPWQMRPRLMGGPGDIGRDRAPLHGSKAYANAAQLVDHPL